MAVYNTEAYLQQAIDSVLTQTLSDIELVIVDDGSTDSSWSIASAATRDRRVIARRRTSSGGASQALNEGLALATGEYITRQDADDASLPSRLAEQVAAFQADPSASAVGTQAVLIDAAGNRLSETSYPAENSEIQPLLLEFMCFVGPSVMARQAAFERAGFWFDTGLSGSEDYDLCLRLSEVGTVVNLNRPLYLYRKHGASVSYLRRHQQLARKAMALENALRRRHGAAVPDSAWKGVGRDFLRAALVAHAAHEAEARQTSLERALNRYPQLFADAALVDKVVRRYVNTLPDDSRHAFVETLFAEVLPETRSLRGLRRRIVTDLHISALLARETDSGNMSAQLWTAIRSNPSWLFQPKVVSFLMKTAVSRARGTGPGLVR